MPSAVAARAMLWLGVVMVSKRLQLHRAFRRFIERAAVASLTEAHGLTPREQVDRLIATEALPQHDLKRLQVLFERCIYQQTDSPGDAAECLGVCERLTEALPLAPREARRIRSILPGWLPSLARRCVFPSMTVLTVVGVVVGLRYSRPDLSFGGSASSWSPKYAVERRQCRANTGAWNKPASNPTYVAASIPKYIGPAENTATQHPGIDQVTGVDIRFPTKEDPFRPPLGWTHRRFVYTSLDNSFRFQLAGGPHLSATEGADGRSWIYNAKVRAILKRGQSVPIPSPSPDAIVTDYRCSPKIPIMFVKDAGDGLHAIATVDRTVDLRYTCAVGGDYSFAPLPEVPYVPAEIPLPTNVRADAQVVIKAIGGLPAPTYAATVRRLHAYFAGFSVSPINDADLRRNAFLTIALSRKGVCRHRARTFVPVAQALGIPTRLVENSIHSFAEVQLPGGTWRRLEFRLGDEEIPPSPSPQLVARDLDGKPLKIWSPWPVLSVFWSVIGVAGLVFWRNRSDATAHMLSDVSVAPPSTRRAHRNDKLARPQDTVDKLAKLVRAHLARQLDVNPDEGDKVRAALWAADPPPGMVARLEHVLQYLDQRDADSFWATHLQGLYWDCHYILRWLRARDDS